MALCANILFSYFSLLQPSKSNILNQTLINPDCRPSIVSLLSVHSTGKKSNISKAKRLNLRLAEWSTSSKKVELVS